MGGAPWTSKACKNCKASKVRCDLQKPECGRCVRRGTVCPGYESRPFIITTSQQGNPKQVLRNFASKRAVTRTQPIKISQVINPGPAKCVQISSNYINRWFPMDNPQISGIDMYFGKDTWYQIFTHVHQISNRSQMLEKAMTAVSLVCLGRHHHDEALVQEGIWWYNSSIRQLLRMIERNVSSEEMVLATNMFQMIELWYSPYGMEAFVAHENATNSFIKKLTEAQASAPAMKLLIRDQRRLSIISVMITNDMSHTARVGQSSEEDTPLDDLFEIMAPISNLVFASNIIEDSNWQAAKRIFYAALDHKEEMSLWYARNKDNIGYPFHAPNEFEATGQPSSDPLFGPLYSFINFESAALHVIYWTGMVLVEELIHKTHAILSLWSDDEQFKNLPDRQIGHDMSEFYADEACRSVPYCLSGAAGAWGMGTLLGCFTQLVKPYIVLRQKEKLDYCADIFRLAINNGMGLTKGMLEFVLFMWESYTPPTRKPVQPRQLEFIPATRHVSESSGSELERVENQPSGTWEPGEELGASEA